MFLRTKDSVVYIQLPPFNKEPMSKVTVATITTGYEAVAAINSNFAALQAAIETLLSRDGTSPNAMTADLDMNGKNIINQGNAISVEGFNWRGAWLTTTAYAIGDVVEKGGSAYICIVAHTSGTFATDLSAAKWQLVASASLPTQTGNSGKLLTTNGTTASWTGSPLGLSLGGTGGTDAATARASIGAAASGDNSDITSLASPALGSATATTQSPGDNTTKVATTAFVTTAVAGTGTVTSPMRQTVLYGATSSGVASHLSAGAGLNYNIDATTAPLTISYANGFNTAGASDLLAQLTANATNQGSLTANTTNYLHSTYVTSTSVTWGSSLVPPQYGYAFDKAQHVILNFEGTNGATVTTDDFGNAWTLSGSTVSTGQFKFGTSSLDCSGGTAKYAQSTAFTSLGGGSWELQMWFRINALPTAGNYGQLFRMYNASGAGAQVYLYNSAGTTKLVTYLSGDGASPTIANGQVGTNTTWTTGQWNRLRFVFDALAGTYRIYLSLGGAAETQDWTLSSTTRVCSFSTFVLGRNTYVSGDQFDGHIDGVRLMIGAASVTTTVTPGANAPSVSDYPVHFYSIPAGQMYEVTSASATSGVAPGMTARSRVFHGEADTGASSVSAVRTYAYQGRYDGAWTYTLPTAASKTTVAHNMGTVPATCSLIIECVTSDQGVGVGEQLTTGSLYGYDGSFIVLPKVAASKNNMYIQVPASTGWAVINASGTNSGLTLSRWKYKFIALRGW